jgi:hypothetical protein
LRKRSEILDVQADLFVCHVSATTCFPLALLGLVQTNRSPRRSGSVVRAFEPALQHRRTYDPLFFACVTLLLALVALFVATLFRARAATKANPIVAFRCD